MDACDLICVYDRREETEIYLDIGEVDIVVLKEADELPKIVFGREVMAAVWPYSLR